MAFYETHELHRKEELRTRWFNGSYEDMKKAIFAAADYLGYAVYDCNDTYQEFLLEGPASLVIKVCSYGRYEHGVDFNINTRGFIDFGKGKRMITQFYDALGKHVRFKGVSLHP